MMANNPPGGQPGFNPNKFPQWGIGQINGSWKIVKADDDAEKIADSKKGYLDWFGSEGAANDQVNSQKSALNGNLPSPLHGLDQIGAVLEAFYKNITDPKMWRSLAWFNLGIVLLLVGIVMWMKHANILPDLPIPVPV